MSAESIKRGGNSENWKQGTRRRKIMSKEIQASNEGLKKNIAPQFSALETAYDFDFDTDVKETCFNADYDSEPDRSDPQWKYLTSKHFQEEPKEDVISNDDKNKMTLWEEIMTEYEDKRLEFENLRALEKPYEAPLPVLSNLSAVQYLDKYVFSILCPALEETLLKAKEWDCLMVQKCRFNGLDYISELLWNRNPRHPKRNLSHREIFDIPFAVISLYYHPRPIYPLSWLWSKEEAITVLQSYIRRYLICRESECSEMRAFWKALKIEKDEAMRQNRIKLIEDMEERVNNILDSLVAKSVYEAEWKIYGCHCIAKPCRCVCSCMKWCKCCKCYKVHANEEAP